MGNTERFTIISACNDWMDQRIKSILGRGGCRTFPKYLGGCQCGAKLSSNREKIKCPNCGHPIEFSVKGSFKFWSKYHYYH
ncbi:MAG: hypothetical protein AAB475_02355 [Patescibacteria group bacterium]